MRFKELIQGLDEKPGVYLCLKQDKYLYGKAKNLETSFTVFASTPTKEHNMLSYVVDVQVMITQSMQRWPESDLLKNISHRITFY